jgi:hypothetical protein
MLTPLYAVEIDELDTHTGARKRYFLRDATSTVAVLTLDRARQLAANIASDRLVRRYASVVKAEEAA